MHADGGLSHQLRIISGTLSLIRRHDFRFERSTSGFDSGFVQGFVYLLDFPMAGGWSYMTVRLLHIELMVWPRAGHHTVVIVTPCHY